MPPLSAELKKSLVTAAEKYRNALPGSPAEEYLSRRGLSGYGLGYVDEPVAGHEKYQGKLAIPYIRWSPRNDFHVVSLRFRCIEDHSCNDLKHPKYLTITGDTPRLYNTRALQNDSDVIGIAEGELDAISAEIAGIPTVGVPGAQSWKPYFREAFLGYRTVYVFADGDEPGRKFASGLVKQLPNARAIEMPEGMDVNSFILEKGTEAFLSRLV